MEPVVVGIGASAGGQDAFARFFRHAPVTSGLAFVLIQHLDPNHRSLLPESIETLTRMPVHQAEEDMAVEPNHVYTIPPDRDLVIRQGKFHLVARPVPRTLHLPIDMFFRSLAEEQRERAIAVVLSGTGNDGTLGLGAVKEQGGIVLVQDPATAQFDGMPRSATATGLADLVLPPEEMPGRILGSARQAYAPARAQDQPAPLTIAAWRARILGVLVAQTGHDLAGYKPKTIERRIERRMAINQIRSAAEYYRHLQENQSEAQMLFGDLLIGVTQFFRDPEAFAALQTQAMPQLLRVREDGQIHGPVRVWVPGCATGEEAYSIAMLMQETLEAAGQDVPVTIFASDLDSHAIDIARSATYPLSIAADVSPERLARFFVETDGKYRITERIRNMVVFAVQDVVKDPPFSRLDLISCRNLLIYLGAAAQKRAMAIFHYALKPDGLLFLGSAELPEASARLFVPLDRKHRLFRRSSAASRGRTELAYRPDGRAAPPKIKENARVNLGESVQKMLLEAAPPCLVVNRAGDILHIHGRTGKYLEPTQGDVGQANALRMAREGLRGPLSAAVAKAISEQQPVTYDRVRVKTDGDEVCLRLTVRPLSQADGDERLLAVIFEELTPALCAPVPAAAGSGTSGEPAARVAELERELRAAQEYLQATVEELESANEELRSANEEMQSTNEELVTSREELQSVNEELVTLNSEHEAKIEALTVVNADLVNLLTRLDLGIIFLDRELRIRRFNAAATRISSLIETDLGRPLSDLASNLAYDHLTADARAVLETQVSKKVELRAKDGHWYLAHLQVYRAPDNLPDGVMLTFSDITQQVAALAAVQAARQYAESVLETVREPLLILDQDLRVVSANRAYYKAFATSAGSTEGWLLYDLNGGQWAGPRLRGALGRLIANGAAFEDLPVDGAGAGGAGVVVNARCIVQPAPPMGTSLTASPEGPGQQPLILLAVANPQGAL